MNLWLQGYASWSPNFLDRPPAVCHIIPVNPIATGRAIWELKQPACHELGLRAQQPGTVLLVCPFLGGLRGLRSSGVSSPVGKASSMISLCFPEDPGPPLQGLPARRQASWAHFPMSVPGLRVFLGNTGSPFPRTATTISANLTHWEFWGQCMTWRQDT